MFSKGVIHKVLISESSLRGRLALSSSTSLFSGQEKKAGFISLKEPLNCLKQGLAHYGPLPGTIAPASLVWFYTFKHPTKGKQYFVILENYWKFKIPVSLNKSYLHPFAGEPSTAAVTLQRQ